MKLTKRIGFIGCGNMGEALLKGLLGRKVISSHSIYINDAQSTRKKYLKKRYNVRVASSNTAVAKSCDTIILAVKPQSLDQVLTGIRKEANNKNKQLISVAAGVTIKHIQKRLPKSKIIRVMPNTPALVGCGITGICKTAQAKKSDYNLAKNIFSTVGEIIWVKESQMDIVTAVSGSGPAYYFLMIDAILKSACLAGLDKKTAQMLTLGTIYGSSVLALQSSLSMSQLIKKVASKGGTTEAALKVFKKKKFSAIINQAVKAAAKRSKELSK